MSFLLTLTGLLVTCLNCSLAFFVTHVDPPGALFRFSCFVALFFVSLSFLFWLGFRSCLCKDFFFRFPFFFFVLFFYSFSGNYLVHMWRVFHLILLTLSSVATISISFSHFTLTLALALSLTHTRTHHKYSRPKVPFCHCGPPSTPPPPTPRQPSHLLLLVFWFSLLRFLLLFLFQLLLLLVLHRNYF